MRLNVIKKLRHTYITAIFLGIIFLLAAVLRFPHLSSVPVGFHIDEASLGYNGYSLLQTGKDENNHAFPFYIDMFGDNRPSGYHFLTIVPIVIFGLNEFATRFPAAFFGTLSIIAIFFFTKALINNTKISLLTSFLLAISPWHVSLSRASGEAVVALFFILFGFGFILKSLEKQEGKLLLTGAVVSSLSFFFYHTPRVFVPLFFFSLLASFIFIKRKSIHKKFLAAIGISFIFLASLVVFLVFFVSGGTGRYSQVNIFSFPETRLVMEEQFREDGHSGVGPLEARLYHNKVINYSLTFIKNYFAYFTGEFLFISGGLPNWYQIPSMGLVYLVLLPFVLTGAVILVTRKGYITKIPLLWLILAPVTASITVDDIPNINRVIVFFPILELIAAYGFFFILEKMTRKYQKIIICIFSVLLLFNFCYFLHQYFVHAKDHRTWYRNNGFAEMIKKVNKDSRNYDVVYVTKSAGGIYPLVLFYTKFDPAAYHQAGSPKDKDYAQFGKFVFVPQPCPSVDRDSRMPIEKRAIFVNKGDCPDHYPFQYKNIYREDGTRAFRLQYE